jgi:hypothetical protein
MRAVQGSGSGFGLAGPKKKGSSSISQGEIELDPFFLGGIRGVSRAAAPESRQGSGRPGDLFTTSQAVNENSILMPASSITSFSARA